MEVKLEKLTEYTPDPKHKINQLVTVATHIVSSSLGMPVTFAPGPSSGISLGECISISTLRGVGGRWWDDLASEAIRQTVEIPTTIIPNLLALHVLVRSVHEEADQAVLVVNSGSCEAFLVYGQSGIGPSPFPILICGTQPIIN